jgi:hypothetical protein
MPNAQACCSSFKLQMLNGIHCFGTGVIRTTTTADTFKAALYVTTANLGASTVAYTAAGELSSAYGGSNYVAGGQVIVNGFAPLLSGTVACWTPSANLVWSGITIAQPVDCLLVYNASQANAAVVTYTFSAVTITAGLLTFTMPANVAATALLAVY